MEEAHLIDTLAPAIANLVISANECSRSNGLETEGEVELRGSHKDVTVSDLARVFDFPACTETALDPSPIARARKHEISEEIQPSIELDSLTTSADLEAWERRTPLNNDAAAFNERLYFTSSASAEYGSNENSPSARNTPRYCELDEVELLLHRLLGLPFTLKKEPPSISSVSTLERTPEFGGSESSSCDSPGERTDGTKECPPSSRNRSSALRRLVGGSSSYSGTLPTWDGFVKSESGEENSHNDAGVGRETLPEKIAKLQSRRTFSCPCKILGCISTRRFDYVGWGRAMKQHLSVHWICKIRQCLLRNRETGKACEYAGPESSMARHWMSKHGFNSAVDVKAARDLYCLYPAMLRCGGCQMVFSETSEEFPNAGRFDISESVKPLMDWIGHIIACGARGAMKEDGSPGDGSYFEDWASRCGVASHDGSTMSFDGGPGRNSDEKIERSQYICAVLVSYHLHGRQHITMQPQAPFLAENPLLNNAPQSPSHGPPTISEILIEMGVSPDKVKEYNENLRRCIEEYESATSVPHPPSSTSSESILDTQPNTPPQGPRCLPAPVRIADDRDELEGVSDAEGGTKEASYFEAAFFAEDYPATSQLQP